MKLDILTPRGQATLAEEQRVIDSFVTYFDDVQIVQTNKDEPADVDGFFCRNNTIAGIFETKCRKATVDQMMRVWKGEWLITYDKLVKGSEMAKRLRVPFYGLLGLMDEPVGIMVRLADDNGEFCQNMKIGRSTTQRTVNGGSIERVNAYVEILEHTKFPLIDVVDAVPDRG